MDVLIIQLPLTFIPSTLSTKFPSLLFFFICHFIHSFLFQDILIKSWCFLLFTLLSFDFLSFLILLVFHYSLFLKATLLGCIVFTTLIPHWPPHIHLFSQCFTYTTFYICYIMIKEINASGKSKKY